MNNGDQIAMTEWEVELAITSRHTGKFHGLLLINVSAENESGAIAIAKERAMDMLTNRFVVECNGATKIG
jgi:hypothetical protein